MEDTGSQAHVPGHPLPVAVPSGVRVPTYVKTLTLQHPNQARFSVLDLEWTTVHENRQFFQVAAIPVNRLEDFLAGEGERGSTGVPGSSLLNVESKSTKEAPGVLTRLVVRCKYGQLRKKAHKEKASLPMDIVEQQGLQRSALILGRSIKKGCCYEFTVKRYATHPGMAIIKFVSKDGAAAGDLCSTMQHLDASGVAVHNGLTQHVPHTQEVRDFITERLKANCSTRTVLKGAFLRSEYEKWSAVGCVGLTPVQIHPVHVWHNG